MADIIDFRVFQSKIAKKLKEVDRQALVFIYRDYLPESFKKAPTLEILSHLESEGIFSVYAPNNLVEVLKNLDRLDLAKDTEKFLKQQSAKSPKLKGKRTSQKPKFLTPRDAALKARFDHILLLATSLVEQLEKLREALADEEDHHQDSEELLKQCEENASKLERELRKARSASKLSDNSFSDATNVVTALKNVVDEVSALMPEGTPCQPSSLLELERAAQSAPNSPFNTVRRGSGTKKQPMMPPNKKLNLQSRTARMANDGDDNETGDRTGGENCELYETRDLLQDKPYLRADINVNYRRRAQSLPNSPKRIRKAPPARAEHTVSPALSRKPKVSNSIQQTNSTCNYDPTTDSTLEYTTPDQSTEGGTGDSGFEEPLLKVPLNPKVHAYTPLSEDTIERVEDVVYDTAEDQRTSHKGIMNQEHVYENFPSRESKSRQQLISKCK